MPGGQLAGMAHRQRRAPQAAEPSFQPAQLPEQPGVAPLLPLPPACTGNHPAGNPTSPLQSKPQGIGLQERDIHLQETEPGQSGSPGRPRGKGVLRRKGWGSRRGQASRAEEPEGQPPKAPKQGSRAETSGSGMGGQGQGPWEDRWRRHRLLGAVHEAAVQLRKLPVGDVAAALLQILQGYHARQDLVSPTSQGLLASPAPPAGSAGGLTVSRSRRKRMLGTR